MKMFFTTLCIHLYLIKRKNYFLKSSHVWNTKGVDIYINVLWSPTCTCFVSGIHLRNRGNASRKWELYITEMPVLNHKKEKYQKHTSLKSWEREIGVWTLRLKFKREEFWTLKLIIFRYFQNYICTLNVFEFIDFS